MITQKQNCLSHVKNAIGITEGLEVPVLWTVKAVVEIAVVPSLVVVATRWQSRCSAVGRLVGRSCSRAANVCSLMIGLHHWPSRLLDGPPWKQSHQWTIRHRLAWHECRYRDQTKKRHRFGSNKHGTHPREKRNSLILLVSNWTRT